MAFRLRRAVEDAHLLAVAPRHREHAARVGIERDHGALDGRWGATAFAVAEAVAQTMRREERSDASGEGRSSERIDRTRLAAPDAVRSGRGAAVAPPELLGDSYRAGRRSTRASGAGERRDVRQ